MKLLTREKTKDISKNITKKTPNFYISLTFFINYHCIIGGCSYLPLSDKILIETNTNKELR